MRYRKVRDGGPEVSELGLGCAAMMGSVGQHESLRALGAAWDAGITLYDTARSYGYGEGEALLGEFFRGEKRGRAVISTKFGILPARRGWKQKMKPLAQAVVRAVPALRGVAQRQAATQLVQQEFSVDLLRMSLETSLRALKSDYVDILLMHAAPMTALESDGLLDAMARLVSEGKVRMAGVSGEHAVVQAAFAKRPAGMTTAQFAMGPGSMGIAAATCEASAAGWFLVANRPFGGAQGVRACERRIAAMRADARLPPELRAKLTPDAGLMAEVVLNAVLRGTGVHAAIPAMMQPAHLTTNVRAVEQCRFSDEELELVRATMEAE